jgi:hypothetical protein
MAFWLVAGLKAYSRLAGAWKSDFDLCFPRRAAHGLESCFTCGVEF